MRLSLEKKGLAEKILHKTTCKNSPFIKQKKKFCQAKSQPTFNQSRKNIVNKLVCKQIIHVKNI